MEKNILYLIEQAGACMLMPRTHLKSLGNTFDTVASHSFHVAIIAYCLARMEKLSHQDAQEALTMGLFHDLAEARTGDSDFIGKNYVKIDEEKAVHDQFANISFGNDLHTLVEKYEIRDTVVAKCAKDADVIAQVYHEWFLVWQGNKLAEQWFEGDFVHRLPSLRTESAKLLMNSMKDSNPNEWWWDQFVKPGINKDHLNSAK